jgi:hypothetical protein
MVFIHFKRNCGRSTIYYVFICCGALFSFHFNRKSNSSSTMEQNMAVRCGGRKRAIEHCSGGGEVGCEFSLFFRYLLCGPARGTNS